MKRHGYYCRSRKAGPATRLRSCVSCSKGKVRCDNQRPTCSRCISKGIECHYPSKARRPSSRRNSASPIERQNVQSLEGSHAARYHQEGGDDYARALGDAIATAPDADAAAGLDWANDLDWNNTNVDFAEFLKPSTNDKTLQYPSLKSPFQAPYLTPLTDQSFQLQRTITPVDLTIPVSPTSKIRSLVHRPKTKSPGAQKIAGLIYAVLQSYPRMMLRHDDLPPFIHRSLIATDSDAKEQLEPLTNCISLVHTTASGIPMSRKLFWRNVRMECERWCQEVRAFRFKVPKWPKIYSKLIDSHL